MLSKESLVAECLLRHLGCEEVGRDDKRNNGEVCEEIDVSDDWIEENLKDVAGEMENDDEENFEYLISCIKSEDFAVFEYEEEGKDNVVELLINLIEEKIKQKHLRKKLKLLELTMKCVPKVETFDIIKFLDHIQYKDSLIKPVIDESNITVKKERKNKLIRKKK